MFCYVLVECDSIGITKVVKGASQKHTEDDESGRGGVGEFLCKNSPPIKFIALHKPFMNIINICMYLQQRMAACPDRMAKELEYSHLLV